MFYKSSAENFFVNIFSSSFLSIFFFFYFFVNIYNLEDKSEQQTKKVKAIDNKLNEVETYIKGQNI